MMNGPASWALAGVMGLMGLAGICAVIQGSREAKYWARMRREAEGKRGEDFLERHSSDLTSLALAEREAKQREAAWTQQAEQLNAMKTGGLN